MHIAGKMPAMRCVENNAICGTIAIYRKVRCAIRDTRYAILHAMKRAASRLSEVNSDDEVMKLGMQGSLLLYLYVVIKGLAGVVGDF